MSDEINTNLGGEILPPPNNTPGPEDDLIAQAEKKKTCKKMRRCFNSCGWALFTMMCCWLTASGFVITIIRALDGVGIPAYDFYVKYYMVFNELTLGIGILIAWLVLSTSPKSQFQKQKFSFGNFMLLFPICIAMGYVGNFISNIFITFWNVFTGNSVTNEVSELIMDTDIWVIFLFVGIIGPILEELFFRKLLIDRLRPYGELASILVSAVFFAFFHMNFSQLLYAFGVGLILGYLYYRSGNFVLTVALHALFNILMSAVQMLLYEPVMEYYAKVATITEESEMYALLSEYLVPLALYGIYLLAIFALVIVGIVFFCINIRKFKPQKSELALEKKDYRSALFKSSGMIAATVILLVLTISSLFS